MLHSKGVPVTHHNLEIKDEMATDICIKLSFLFKDTASEALDY